jgi:hypothetical protein
MMRFDASAGSWWNVPVRVRGKRAKAGTDEAFV